MNKTKGRGTIINLVSGVDLAFYLGINVRTIAKLVEKGVLQRQSGSQNFNLAESIAAYIAYREQVCRKEAGQSGP
jgi:hypothetical protein